MATSKIPALVKNRSFSGTTDGNGNVTVALGEELNIVRVDSGNTKAFSFTINGDTILSCYDFNSSVRANQSVSGTIYYI